ncbi:hypothetical protein DE146DRAFT_793337 [Phaeosphaeria sp. MPI-PUGE-AT-0046c]|nr:hypothetical protein DE146DRAFT_793337 [Phaeosphaeria sp. MPI-PUGE-AT-0046c]
MAQLPVMNGYSKLASMMGLNPELAIFRRFSALNAHSLLLLQAELVFLENKLKRCIDADTAYGHDLRTIYDRDWQSMFESATKPDGCAEQWETVVRARSVLKEYNEALLLQKMLAKEEGPLAPDITYLQDWMKRTTMGCVYLIGADSDVYEKPVLEDLIAIKRHRGHNLASRTIADFWVKVWRRMIFWRTTAPSSGMYANTIHYSDSTLTKLGEVLGTMCASTLPVLAIVTLYYVQSMGRRLAAIAVFTSIFSAVLGIFSNGRRIEIFAATAGFAAVQVVFVGTVPSINSEYVKP